MQSGPVLSGALQAWRAATMRAEVQGAVLEMRVEQGQQVKEGKLLARLEDTSPRDQWGDFRAPLGRAVIGGVITSTPLTLLVIPTVYGRIRPGT